MHCTALRGADTTALAEAQAIRCSIRQHQACAAFSRHRTHVRPWLTHNECSAGITTGYDASLLDLLAPGAAGVSLKEISASSALERLLQHPVEAPDDVFEVWLYVLTITGRPYSGHCTAVQASLWLSLIA